LTKPQQAMMFIKHFATGLLIPVLNILLLQKGATLQTLPLLLATYSVTVVCLELPSGIFADMYGRKAVFLLSCVLKTIAVLLLSVGGNLAWLIFTMIFYGSGRAFSSGSLDALFIDQAMDRWGDSILAKVTARLTVLEGVGFAVGSICGGFLASVTRTYLSNLAVQVLLNVILFVVCLFLVSESPTVLSEQRPSIRDHLNQGKRLVLSSRNFTLILMGVLIVGFFLSTIETYWQPTFITLSKRDNILWMLGLITFTGFSTTILGSTLGQRLMDRFINKWWAAYNICRVSFGISIIVFALQTTTGGFVAGYIIVYLFLGINSVVETTIINKLTPANMRASILSLSSLMAQIGMLFASLFSSLLVIPLGVSGVWIAAGILMGGYAVIVVIVTKDKKSAVQEASLSNK
jgi:MFS family permease